MLVLESMPVFEQVSGPAWELALLQGSGQALVMKSGLTMVVKSVPVSDQGSEQLWVLHAPMRGQEPTLVLESMPVYERVLGPLWDPALVQRSAPALVLESVSVSEQGLGPALVLVSVAVSAQASGSGREPAPLKGLGKALAMNSVLALVVK